MFKGYQISETNENKVLGGQNTLHSFARLKLLPDQILF